MSRHIFVVLTLAIVTAANAQTQPPQPSAEVTQAANELSALVSGGMKTELTERTVKQVWPAIEKAVREQNPAIDARTVADLRKEFERLSLESLPGLMKDAPTIYARHFTAQEMQDVIAFYKTPSGARFLQSMPQVTSDLRASMAARSQGLQQKITLAFLNLLQKRGLYAR